MSDALKFSIDSNIGIFQNKPQCISISTGSTIVTIKPDGTIEYGEGYTPDAAAKAFWDAIGLERKNRQQS